MEKSQLCHIPFHLIFVNRVFIFGNRHFCSSFFCCAVGFFCLFIFNGLKILIPDLGKMGTKYQGKVKTQLFAVFLIRWLLQFLTKISLSCKPDFGVQSHVQGAAVPPWHQGFYCMKTVTRNIAKPKPFR